MTGEVKQDGDTSPPVDEPQRKYTPAQRIEELNDIDKSLTHLLESAATAMTILANHPSTKRPFIDSQKDAFTQATKSYFSALSNIDVRLRRNVYALEEAGFIQKGDKLRDGARGVAAIHSDESRTGGNGPLDKGWLNARSSDSVGNGMDQEIWADARKFVELLEARMIDQVDGGAAMEVDTKDG